MLPFATLYARAVERKGSAALEARLPSPLTAAELREVPDDRVLAMMTRRVFQAGFVWRVIENKWDGFEAAFHGFDPGIVANLSAEEIATLQADARIVRNGQKIHATIANAVFVQDIATEHGSFGRFLAAWPEGDIIGLWDVLKKRGKRLGGDTGPRVLRGLGKDTFILTEDVVQCLVDQGIVSKKPTSKRDLDAVHEAFATWKAESGRPLCALSILLACTVGPS